jgi:protein tyrosine/serine phosphatase
MINESPCRQRYARAIGPLFTAVVLIGAGLLVTAGPVRADSPDLPNFHVVSPGIYRGAAPTPAGLRRLRAMGVRTVIDLRIAPKTVRKEKTQVESLGLNWINLPMSGDPPTQAQVDRLIGALKAAPHDPVFVHCQHGADRTGCMLGIYRETQQGWDFDKTYKEMRQYGFKPYYVKLADAVRKRAPERAGTGRPKR